MEKLPSYITGIVIWLFIIYLTYRHYAVPIRKYKKDTKITCKREEKPKNLKLRKIKEQTVAKTIVKHATKGQPDADFVKIDISSAHQGDNMAHEPRRYNKEVLLKKY